MKILLTGATGYIGKRLLPVLVEAGHDVICCVRDVKRFNPPESIKRQISVIEIDLLDETSLTKIPEDIDAAYYLVHSMSSSSDYESLEETSAINFRNALIKTKVKHVIYLSGIINETELSKQMLLDFAKNRNLKRKIFVVPVMTPKLSSYWLYFVTSTSYKLAVSLVHSMKVEVICRDNRINTILDIKPLNYADSLKKAFTKIENNEILSSWKDSYSSSGISFNISDFINVPTFGCFIDQRTRKMDNRDACISKIWSIGGQSGWYYANWLWSLRGLLDKLAGGVGLRRGRTSQTIIHVGDTIDFWRVLYANNEEGRLLLFAEMKLPGEAWLEFKVIDGQLQQTATFRPLGLVGRLYWYSVLPFHGLIFKGMLRKLTTHNK